MAQELRSECEDLRKSRKARIALLLDVGTYQQQHSIATLYLATVTIVCWTLSTRQAVIFTIAVAMIAGARYPMLNPDPDF